MFLVAIIIILSIFLVKFNVSYPERIVQNTIVQLCAEMCGLQLASSSTSLILIVAEAATSNGNI